MRTATTQLAGQRGSETSDPKRLEMRHACRAAEPGTISADRHVMSASQQQANHSRVVSGGQSLIPAWRPGQLCLSRDRTWSMGARESRRCGRGRASRSARRCCSSGRAFQALKRMRLNQHSGTKTCTKVEKAAWARLTRKRAPLLLFWPQALQSLPLRRCTPAWHSGTSECFATAGLDSACTWTRHALGLCMHSDKAVTTHADTSLQ